MDKHDDNRLLLVHRAYFRRYVPRRGLADHLSALAGPADTADTMVAILAPPSFASLMKWTADGQLDVSAALCAWIRKECVCDDEVLFLSAYTAELELDVAEVAAQATSENSLQSTF